jgi:hypothetical protein
MRDLKSCKNSPSCQIARSRALSLSPSVIGMDKSSPFFFALRVNRVFDTLLLKSNLIQSDTLSPVWQAKRNHATFANSLPLSVVRMSNLDLFLLHPNIPSPRRPRGQILALYSPPSGLWQSNPFVKWLCTVLFATRCLSHFS